MAAGFIFTHPIVTVNFTEPSQVTDTKNPKIRVKSPPVENQTYLQLTTIDYGNVIAYKILTDYKLPSTYYRLTNVGTTKLAANLAYADTQVVVVSTDGLLDSGAVWINAERIVYRGIDRTHGLLLNLRRGTLRTSVPALHAVGSLVTDATSAEHITDDFVSPISQNTVVSGNLNVADNTTYLTSLTSVIPQGKIWLQ
jgi:hypothetical protein